MVQQFKFTFSLKILMINGKIYFFLNMNFFFRGGGAEILSKDIKIICYGNIMPVEE